jgi:hypothetical protein
MYRLITWSSLKWNIPLTTLSDSFGQRSFRRVKDQVPHAYNRLYCQVNRALSAWKPHALVAQMYVVLSCVGRGLATSRYPVHGVVVIIIIGSTALRGPWPCSEASVSWSIRLLLLQISWQVFYRLGCQPHSQPPAIMEGWCFLSGLSPIAD